MIQGDDFRALMARLRGGDRRAASQIVARFADRLTDLAGRRLDRRLRPKLDPEDVTQAVFHNFFEQCARGSFRLDGWDDLWAVFSMIAVRRCAWEGRHHRAARRDVRRESDPAAAMPEWIGEFAGAADAPEQALLLAETFDHVLGQLNEIDRDVVRLALQGWTVPEISAEVGRTPRTVYRVLSRLRDLLTSPEPAEA